jgi:polyhydroxyalkanoate synthesis repressor PhaR
MVRPERILMVIIKRYPNRKLYNTDTKQYITLDGIAELIRDGTEISVVDNATGEELTALTLTQIILELEKKQTGLLSNSILTGLIRAGGESLSALQRGLNYSLSIWSQIDEDIKQRIQGLVKNGDLTDGEGKNLLDKLVEQGHRMRAEQTQVKGHLTSEVETILQQRQTPTRDDIQRLNQQLDELSSRLAQFSDSASNSNND